MRARDLATTATRDTTGAEAVPHIAAEYRLSALAVVGPEGLPIALLPGGFRLLALVVPPYVRDNPPAGPRLLGGCC